VFNHLRFAVRPRRDDTHRPFARRYRRSLFGYKCSRNDSSGGFASRARGAQSLFPRRPPRSAGQKTLSVGTEISAANLVELSGNFLLASAIEALGEAVALVAKAGIDRHAFVNLLTSTIFPVPAYKTYGDLIADNRFQPARFAAPLGKDILLTFAAAESLCVPMPLGRLLHDRFLWLFAQGGDDLDWAAIGGLSAQDAHGP
jgi:3-hydroxyisobutyrate dehydrogenase-like beta-hydroxyacid dehydrogenase